MIRLSHGDSREYGADQKNGSDNGYDFLHHHSSSSVTWHPLTSYILTVSEEGKKGLQQNFKGRFNRDLQESSKDSTTYDGSSYTPDQVKPVKMKGLTPLNRKVPMDSAGQPKEEWYDGLGKDV
jgi:hypothetical protein